MSSVAGFGPSSAAWGLTLVVYATPRTRFTWRKCLNQLARPNFAATTFKNSTVFPGNGKFNLG